MAAVRAESALMPARIHFRERPEVSLLRPCLGLSIYLEPERGWAEEWASDLFTSFLDLIDPRALRWWTSSTEAKWRTIDDLASLAAHLRSASLLGRARHLFRFSTADDLHAPSVGFTYREIDFRRAPPLGYVEISLPLHTDPDALLALAIEVSQRFPIACGIGGYAFRWNVRYPRNAFHAAFKCCRRFLGVDIQHADMMAWHATRELAGVGWITLLGATAQRAEIDVAALAREPWAHPVQIMPLRYGTLVKAGASPQVGDVNRMDYPVAQAEVAQRLDRYVSRSFELPGAFEEESMTEAWRSRFSHPEAWS